jgi:multiple RNA-binding domain-containing protein 1
LVLFEKSSDAINAFQNADGVTFQGRIVHLLPAKAKRDANLDEYSLAQLPLKKQALVRKKEAASKTFNWNALYMSQDAVNESISRRLGVSKSEFLDPSSSDAAVKQAMAESQLIQETKAYFAANGVDLNAFKSQNQKGDKAILVKNFAYGTSMEELRRLFEEHGKVIRVLMPPAGTTAIVEMVDSKAAFSKLAYRRFKDAILFLEKAPRNIFKGAPVPEDEKPQGADKLSVAGLLERDDKQEAPETSSLYVGNLNFSTTTEQLAEAFKPLDGFVSARVKTKQNLKKPGQVLSMGFGFVAFVSFFFCGHILFVYRTRVTRAGIRAKIWISAYHIDYSVPRSKPCRR